MRIIWLTLLGTKLDDVFRKCECFCINP